MLFWCWQYDLGRSELFTEEEVKYTLKLMLDRGLVFDETTRYGVVQVGQLTWEEQNYYESEVSPDQRVRKRPHQ